MSESTPQYCAKCGYPAVGWATPNCPECGGEKIITPQPLGAAKAVLF